MSLIAAQLFASTPLTTLAVAEDNLLLLPLLVLGLVLMLEEEEEVMEVAAVLTRPRPVAQVASAAASHASDLLLRYRRRLAAFDKAASAGSGKGVSTCPYVCTSVEVYVCLSRETLRAGVRLKVLREERGWVQGPLAASPRAAAADWPAGRSAAAADDSIAARTTRSSG